MAENTLEISPDNDNALARGKKQKKILVVEDDATHRTFMEVILSDNGYTAVPAESGFVALDKLETYPAFDLVIMDWELPGMNGLEAAREIRRRQAERGWPHIPIIAFTSHRSEEDRERCLAAGMDAYLPKDIWMPRWHALLAGQLNALLGNVDPSEETVSSENNEYGNGAQDFDEAAFMQASRLLKEALGETIEEYLEDAAAYIREIKAGMESHDALRIERGSHPLKSNSRSLGLAAVSRIAEAMNMKAQDCMKTGGDTGGISPLLGDLQRAFAQGEKELRTRMRQGKY